MTLAEARAAYDALHAEMITHLVEHGPPWPKPKWAALHLARRVRDEIERRPPVQGELVARVKAAARPREDVVVDARGRL